MTGGFNRMLRLVLCGLPWLLAAAGASAVPVADLREVEEVRGPPPFCDGNACGRNGRSTLTKPAWACELSRIDDAVPPSVQQAYLWREYGGGRNCLRRPAASLDVIGYLGEPQGHTIERLAGNATCP